MSVLKVKNLNYSFGEKNLYNDCEFVLNPKEHLGVVGKNGVGKSTLLKIIMDKITPDKVDIEWQPKIKIRYLDQYAEIDKNLTIEQYLKMAFFELYELEKKMIEYYEKSDDPSFFDKAIEIQNKLELHDFYNIDIQIEKMCAGLGLLTIGLNTKISEISGGQRAKVILVKLLLDKPDVILLDEPTNFLDVEHVEWLSTFLKSFEKSFIIISHNTDFLNKVTTHILEINNHKFTKFTGNYESYLKQKELMVDDYEKKFEKQQKIIEKTEDFIRRNIAGSNSKNARGRRKQLERMEKMPPPAKERPKPVFVFNQLNCSPQQKLIIENLTIGYSFPLIKNINLTIVGGEKIVIKGFNGVGKSTLLKTIMNIIEPISGNFHFSDSIKKIYYEQDLKWENNSLNAIEIFRNKHPELNEREIRSILSKNGLSTKDVFQNVSSLSGGEQAKLKLALLSMQKTNFLIMDEPTNHLDVSSKESLKDCLKKFSGTLLLVSHEPDFYKDLVTKVFDISKFN